MKELSVFDIGLIANDYKVLGFSLSFVIFICAILFCWRRAGSLYFFWDRLWFIVGGRKQFNNDKLNKIWEDVRDVELFRYRSGFAKVYSTLAIEKIENWLIKNKIELSEIIRVNVFFDDENIIFEKHNYVFRAKFCAIVIFVFSILFFFSAMMVNDKHLLLNIVKTDTYFLYSGKKIAIHWGYLDEEVCKEKYYATNDLEKILDTDRKKFNKIVACQIFERGDEYYKNKLKEQEKFFLILSLIFMILIFYLFKKLYALKLAENIHVRLFKYSSAKNRRFS